MVAIPIRLYRRPPRQATKQYRGVVMVEGWRSPDRDIHRLLTCYGPQTVTDLRTRHHMTIPQAHNALARLARLGLVAVADRVRRRGALVWQVV